MARLAETLEAEMSTRIRGGIALAGICAIAITAALGFAIVAKDLGGPDVVTLLERGVECDVCETVDYHYVITRTVTMKGITFTKGDSYPASSAIDVHPRPPGVFTRSTCRVFSSDVDGALGDWSAGYCEIDRVTERDAVAFYAGGGTEPAA